MEIKKFNANAASSKDKVYTIHGKPIRQMNIDSYNSQGYKLYYYSDFQLIEITSLIGVKFNWKDAWGEIIFFLNDEEYDNAMKSILKSKELYDAHLRSAKLIAELPMSHIYHDILKL